jgi:UDP-glucose:tetrahydrobiopterin glucosyltransferase
MDIIFLASSIGPLGYGMTGGVEYNIFSLAEGLLKRGHKVTLIVPRKSKINIKNRNLFIIKVNGNLHLQRQSLERNVPQIIPTNSVLTNMWQKMIKLAITKKYDIVLNFSYDPLPFEKDEECPIPIAHLVSMSSLSNEMDNLILNSALRNPYNIAMHSIAQRDTFNSKIKNKITIVHSGINLKNYDFQPKPNLDIAFVGRVASEKGIFDAFEIAALSKRRLCVFGLMQNLQIWQQAKSKHPEADVVYMGFLTNEKLQKKLGKYSCLIMVHKWVEAFGMVALEALACGVPVITYNRGAPKEIVRHGLTGFIVEKDRTTEVVKAIEKLDLIDRKNCRMDISKRFSDKIFIDKVEKWLKLRAMKIQ